MSPVQQELQIWIVGTLNIIKLIGMFSTFAQILGKLKNNKISKNLKFLLYWAHLFSPSQPLCYRGPPLMRFSLLWITLLWFLAYIRGSGGFLQAYGPFLVHEPLPVDAHFC